MYSKLAVIAVTGLAVSAVCLGGAFALGGNAVGNAGLRPEPLIRKAGVVAVPAGGAERVARNEHARAFRPAVADRVS